MILITGCVCTGGDHEWRHGRYVRASGRMVRVHRARKGNDGRWDRREDHYDWHPGGWRRR